MLSDDPTSPPHSGPNSPGHESVDGALYHQPAKDPHRPSAARLAKRLFHMDGFKKSDVTKHLSKKNEFAQLVGEEYLSFFDYSTRPLDEALRDFLKHVLLAGETQERERVLVHFSRRYVLCNPQAFNSEDACHTLTCALMLLNNDLHGQNIGRKMSVTEFIENLAELNDGSDFPKEVLQQVYQAIKDAPLECEFGRGGQDPVRYIGHNPFLDIPDPSKAIEYKKGFVMRKCCIDPDGRKTPLGKRSWKMFYATMRDMVIYLHKDEHGFKKSSLVADNLSSCIRIHHALATKATDYRKKQHVFRLQTADAAQFLFQTSDSKECEEWIDTINFVASCLSAPPLPGGVGSQRKFQRPLMPASYTKLNMREQLLHHENRAMHIEQELNEHRRTPPDKGAKSRVIQDYVEKESYLHFELRRFNVYCFLLQAKMVSFHPDLEPSLVEVAIGEVDEPPSPPPRTAEQPLLAPPDPAIAKSKPVQRSMSDRYSYRAAIYCTDTYDPSAEL
ncbi:hypothetical protein CAPTEDRAFT_113638 [Capitella teleta]|uniref:SEC7 domain-containing protein n=1 Tax=Capitella teleta TaxID=283909 RepID=R7VD12_CAPTE|nr:hypothetical protein CAPTEDRAFT_113638 [Capitella teleta]|eukprot:ELU16703.1 hypothetical protein CAPTEDRAFT_113638 [Capitella teleta]